ncbi:hypothetical protein C9I57_31890 [Trinickia symbiotica]|uniref:Uncharacterized protein n=1 Tax=Trinickia symbiotica TaxID=863227 RepID=A0A2T3XJU6_9BURK|nr:hypothetical protein C9I57_31890 [Trinickia symbiotica]
MGAMRGRSEGFGSDRPTNLTAVRTSTPAMRLKADQTERTTTTRCLRKDATCRGFIASHYGKWRALR